MEMKQKSDANQHCLQDLHAWALSLASFSLCFRKTKLGDCLQTFRVDTSGENLQVVHNFVLANEQSICPAMMDQLDECIELEHKWNCNSATDHDIYMWADGLLCILKTLRTNKPPQMSMLLLSMMGYARKAREEEA